MTFLKKKYICRAGFVMILVAAVFLSGPRVDLNTTLHPTLALPPDLDTYLAQREAAYDDIVPGTEKKIVWAHAPGEQTPLAIVYVHGFSASRQDTSPLAARVAAQLHANLYSTRLSGHGRGSAAMLEGSVNGWLGDMHEAMEIGKRLGRRVVIMGISTGGTLAIWQAAHSDRDEIAALVLLSPNLGPADRRTEILTWPWGAQLAELLVGKTRSWKPVNEAHGRYWTSSYSVRALLPMMGLVKLTRSLDLQTIKAPTLVIYAPDDKTVDTTAIIAAFQKMGAKEKKLVAYDQAGDPDRHVLAGDILSPGSTAPLVQIIVDFLAGLQDGS
ncbi:MAG: alpha/beta fold hydrolase [Deltaproteobacteria bacterium]|nr:alpha/beta fold hydrolase [Deltaproteobacteria bacterium]